MREQLDRAKALQRLFERQMDKTPDSLALEQRQAQAARMMDQLVGDQWRVEVRIPGVKIVASEALAAPAGPSAEALEQTENNAFWCRVKRAMSDVGDHPDGIAFDLGQEREAAKLARGLHRLKSRLETLLASLTK